MVDAWNIDNINWCFSMLNPILWTFYQFSTHQTLHSESRANESRENDQEAKNHQHLSLSHRPKCVSDARFLAGMLWCLSGAKTLCDKQHLDWRSAKWWCLQPAISWHADHSDSRLPAIRCHKSEGHTTMKRNPKYKEKKLLMLISTSEASKLTKSWKNMAKNMQNIVSSDLKHVVKTF